MMLHWRSSKILAKLTQIQQVSGPFITLMVHPQTTISKKIFPILSNQFCVGSIDALERQCHRSWKKRIQRRYLFHSLEPHKRRDAREYQRKEPEEWPISHQKEEEAFRTRLMNTITRDGFTNQNCLQIARQSREPDCGFFVPRGPCQRYLSRDVYGFRSAMGMGSSSTSGDAICSFIDFVSEWWQRPA